MVLVAKLAIVLRAKLAEVAGNELTGGFGVKAS